jgi:DNA polymerase-3 subunit gamma/tau
MGVALYRKYRSKKLSEIVGQEHITTTLSHALKSGRISHAYLLTGPRGVGKTSIARILAHEVNNLTYDEDASHLDVIEIDAASNRGIEEIRDLREKIHSAPASAKYKVYIIDEVHMLTKPAFNALLKTLEEPPSHVIFILATTEAHKLPETIISRCMRFTFKPIEHTKAVEHLRSIAKSESIAISDEALRLIVEHSEGSFRDSISLLDQISSGSGATEADDVLRMLGIPPADAISQLLDKTLHGSPHELLEHLARFREQGFQAAAIAKRAGSALRQRLLDNQLPLDTQHITEVLRRLLDVPSAHDPDSLLEIILLGLNLQTGGSTPVRQPQKAANSAPAEPKNRQSTATKEKPAVVSDSNKPNTQTQAQPKKAAAPGTPIMDIWPQVLTTVKKRHNTIYSVLRMAQPKLNQENELVLAFAYTFHQKKMNEEKSRLLIRDVLADVLGRSVSVVCVVEKNIRPPQVTVADAKTIKADTKSGDSIDNISNIFGGAEVLES